MMIIWDIYGISIECRILKLAHLMGICSTGIVKSWNFTVNKNGDFYGVLRSTNPIGGNG